MKKKSFLRASFFFLVIGCTITYFIGNKHGILAYITLKKEFDRDKETVTQLEQEIDKLRQEIKEWKTDPFKKECIARQDLGMSFTNELVYVIPQDKNFSRPTQLASA